MRKDKFLKAVCSLAIPVALQSMLQSSFSMVDQIMIGQLGEISVAGVGLAGKFASIYSVVISAIGAVTGIMISQYLGQKNNAEVRRSIFVNLLLGALMAVVFAAVCALFSSRIMGIYTSDERTRQAAAEYLALMAGTFLPMAGATLLSTAFRCAEKPQLPLYASILSAILNTGLNYILIFGRLGAAAMGAKGAAVATVVSQCANFLVMLLMARKALPVLRAGERWKRAAGRLNWRQYWTMLLPMLVCEVAWSLGENVYAAIYGHMGTDASAAMTLINPIQGLVIGALCGLSQAGIQKADRLRCRWLRCPLSRGAFDQRPLCEDLSGGSRCKDIDPADLGRLCDYCSVQGPEHDPGWRDPPQRRPDEVRYVHRHRRHLVLWCPPGSGERLCPKAARSLGVFYPFTGGMRSFQCVPCCFLQEKVDEQTESRLLRPMASLCYPFRYLLRL